MDKSISVAAICAVVLMGSVVAQAGPYATNVISYQAGTNASGGYNDPNTALGEPERVTGEGAWPGDVTMFNSPWGTDEIVSIGAGGHLIVQFDHPVVDNPVDVNWGIDLLVFGNAFFNDLSYPSGIADGISAEPARIAVSQDNVTWYEISGVYADGLFPTQGYADTSGPYEYNGTAPSDFTMPVDPSIDWNGKNYSQLLAMYGGSGGGAGVDISGTGLGWIQYVKVYQDSGDTWSAEIDAFADVVPEPATVALLALGGGAALLRRRRK